MTTCKLFRNLFLYASDLSIRAAVTAILFAHVHLISACEGFSIEAAIWRDCPIKLPAYLSIYLGNFLKINVHQKHRSSLCHYQHQGSNKAG